MRNQVFRFVLLIACCGEYGHSQSPSQPGVTQSGADRVRLSEILIPLSASPSAEEQTAAEKEAQSIIDALHSGVPFEQEARQHSKGPTAAQGGNLGYFARGVLAPALDSLVFTLPVGATTKPIRTKQGLAIIKVTDHSSGAQTNGQGNVDILSDTGGVDFGPYLSSAMETSSGRSSIAELQARSCRRHIFHSERWDDRGNENILIVWRPPT